MLLAIDVGNTHITVGAFQSKKLLHTWRITTNRNYTSDELGVQFLDLLKQASPQPSPLRERETSKTTFSREGDQRANDFPFEARAVPAEVGREGGEARMRRSAQGAAITGVCIASVVPPLDEPLVAMSKKYLKKKPLMVTPSTPMGIKNLYKNPDEVGADRLVNAVAVHTLYRKAAIVVDFGTATTLDCVTAKGEYLGGAICPGLEGAGEWLATHTAKLPRITFQAVPTRAIGKTTKESLQSGLFWGYIALVEGLLHRLTSEMGACLPAGRAKPIIIVTGGLSTVIGPHLNAKTQIVPNLTLDGLRLIWEKNQRRKI